MIRLLLLIHACSYHISDGFQPTIVLVQYPPMLLTPVTRAQGPGQFNMGQHPGSLSFTARYGCSSKKMSHSCYSYWPISISEFRALCSGEVEVFRPGFVAHGLCQRRAAEVAGHENLPRRLAAAAANSAGYGFLGAECAKRLPKDDAVGLNCWLLFWTGQKLWRRWSKVWEGQCFFFENIFSEMNSCKFCEQLLVFFGSCDQQPSWKLMLDTSPFVAREGIATVRMYLATAHLSTKGSKKRIVLGQPSMGSVVPNNILLQMGHYRTLPLAIIANYQQICNIRNIYLMIFACCRGLWSPVAAFFINFPWVGAWQLGLCQVIYLQSNHFILDNHVLLFFIPIW